MKQKRAVNMKVSTGTADEFFERSLERARKIDRGEKLIPEITLTFEDPAEMMQLLSTQRVRIIECLRKNSVPISELATILKRDRKAVSRDVKLLESFGLVKTHDTPNPGHGKMKVVETLAAKYQLVATILSKEKDSNLLPGPFEVREQIFFDGPEQTRSEGIG